LVDVPTDQKLDSRAALQLERISAGRVAYGFEINPGSFCTSTSARERVAESNSNNPIPPGKAWLVLERTLIKRGSSLEGKRLCRVIGPENEELRCAFWKSCT
jgi:hypothetical protein